jgi:hypothetical protein
MVRVILAEGPHGVTHDGGIFESAYRRAPGQVEDRAELPDVVARADLRQDLECTVGPFPVHLEEARLHVVDEVASLTLSKEDLAGDERDPFRITLHVRIREARRQLDDAVGELRDPVVVGGHDHDPPWGGELSEKPKDALHLDVVEVGRRFVGEIATRCCCPPDIWAGR